MILVTMPFKSRHAVTLTFDLLEGQSCCRAGDHNFPNLLVGLISFQKLQPPNTDNGGTSITSCAHRDFTSCNIIVDFLALFSMLYPLSNKIQRNFNETVCESTLMRYFFWRVYYQNEVLIWVANLNWIVCELVVY